MKPAPIHALTSMRFLAALWVVLYHYGQPVLPGLLLPLAKIGYLGVSLFFVLSGFVLTYTYIRPDSNSFNRLSFADARLARIVPLYYLSLAISLPLFVWEHRPFGASEIFVAVATLLTVQVWIPQALFEWNYPSWSVGSEMFFYAMFPIIVVALYRMRIRATIMIYAALFALSVSPAIVIASSGSKPSQSVQEVLAYNPALHLQEFVVGILAALLFQRGALSAHRTAARLAVLLSPLLLFALSFALADVSRLVVHSGVLAPLFALLILCTARADPRSLLVAGRVPVLLGGASYALYLFQAPTWDYMARIFVRLGGDVSAAGFFVAYVVVLVVASILLHVGFEEPLRRSLRAKQLSRRLKLSSRIAPAET